MIDAREEMLVPASHKGRRRPAAVTAGRNLEKQYRSGKKITARRARFQRSPKSNPSTRSNGKGAPRKSPTTPARSSSNRRTSRCPSPGPNWPPRWSSPSTFTANKTPAERETSVRQLIHRVCRTIADWGVRDGYFDKADGEVFYDELTWLCLNQYGAFNSPVWFNVGLFHQYGVGQTSARGNWFYNRQTGQAERARTQYEYPQGSACFIQSVDDNMEEHHAPGPQRGHALQIRLRHRHRSHPHPLQHAKNSAAADAPAARSPSSRSMTRSPTSSNPAAKPAAPPR